MPSADDLTPTARTLVAAVDETLEHPVDGQERLRYAAVAEALGRSDGRRAAELLSVPTRRVTDAQNRLPAYTLATLVAAACASQEVVLDDREDLLRTVRQQIRTGLAGGTGLRPPRWLIPSTIADRTGAHVGALLLQCHGEPARPWLWRTLPEQGRFFILGCNAGSHPAAAHPRCLGTTDLAQLTTRAPVGA